MPRRKTFLLEPAMPLGGEVEWSDAEWVGMLDLDVVRPPYSRVRVVARGGEPFSTARLLVRRAGTVLGFVSVPLQSGVLDPHSLTSGVDALPTGLDVPDAPVEETLPSISVIVCTRDRPEMLRDALTSIIAVDYPDFTVIVVDNAPSTELTRELIEREFAAKGVRYLREPRAGLATARNTGLLAAPGEIVAFTDDDVLVDPGWLRGIVRGFRRGADVELVSGLVPSGELRTEVQAYFDGRVNWSSNLLPAVYRLSEQPEELPMFPFSVGQFGTGANFAALRATLLRLDGFDTALGVGTRTKGGEDLDIFVRTLFGGGAIAIEPSAVIWHRHRAELAALRAQSVGYGRGLGAWLTKVAFTPRMLVRALARAPHASRQLIAKGGGEVTALDGARSAVSEDLASEIRQVGRTELRQVLVGPFAYLMERLGGARGLSSMDDTSADPDDPIVERPMGWAVAAAVCGTAGIVLAAAPWLPSPVATSLAAGAVLIGPGAALASWVRLPHSLGLIAVPATGVAILVAVAGVASQLPGWWSVPAMTLLIAVPTALAGFGRLARYAFERRSRQGTVLE
ncbi:MAG: glycosyltransferase [Protaetiibacter sp.]